MPLDRSTDGQDINPSSALNSEIGDGVDYLDPRWLARSDALIAYNPANSETTSSDTSGSGSTNAVNNSGRGSFNVDTGSTSGSHALLTYLIGRDGLASFDKPRALRTTLHPLNSGDLTAYILTGGQRIGSNGFGFKVTGDNMVGVAIDGGSETTTANLITGVGTTVRDLRAELDPGNSIEFWVDGTKQSETITSGLPSGTTDAIRFITHDIANSAAAAKKYRLRMPVVVQAP